MRRPTGHLSDPVHRRILEKIPDVVGRPRAKNQPFGLKTQVRDVDFHVHDITSIVDILPVAFGASWGLRYGSPGF